MQELTIHHLDDSLVVVEKPTGLLVVPAAGQERHACLVDRLGQQLDRRVYAVHRLDRETTGTLVLALDLETKAALEELFRRHEVLRRYLALTSRVPEPAAARVESKLRVEADGVVRSTVSGPGDRAVTHYRTLARGNRAVLVECRLETGRRNQIRAHLSELGTPILGDRKYGWRPRGGQRIARTMLHAETLEFRHPMHDEQVSIRSKPPADFRQLAPN